MDYFGLGLAFDFLHYRPLVRPSAVDFPLDSSYFAWIAFEGHPFDRASEVVVVVVGAVAVVVLVVEDSSWVAYCLVHYHRVHLYSDYSVIVASV